MAKSDLGWKTKRFCTLSTLPFRNDVMKEVPISIKNLERKNILVDWTVPGTLLEKNGNLFVGHGALDFGFSPVCQ